MKEASINKIQPGNLVIAKKSLKMNATSLEIMSINEQEFDDFFTEEFKKQVRYTPMTSVCKSEALIFLKTKKHLWTVNGIDEITLYKHYFLNGTKILYMSLDKNSYYTFEDIFELVS